jgi:opacity protein-like surface antigen
MKKIIAAATAASLLSVAACADADEATETETTVGEAETAPIDSGAVDTVQTQPEVDGDGVSVGVDENGVRADVRDGDTSVSVDADGNPSAEIEVE